MVDFAKLSRRERQILDFLYATEEGSVQEIRAALPEPPTPMAVRGMLKILEDKGVLKRRKRGREFLYSPRQQRKRVGRNALQHLLDTFFEGSVEKALAAHLERPGTRIEEDELKRLSDLIDQAREKEDDG